MKAIVTSLLAFALCAVLPLQAHAEFDAVKLKAAIESSLETEYPKLDALYKDIHAHPEIAFQEVKTAAKLAAEMRAIGFDVTEGVGKTGLVAIYRNGEGPTIMVRTELDALPMEEKTGLPYASHDKATWNGRETFVAHSCGHDIHMASWVGTAKTLLGLKEQWHGTLMFIAQPAEEEVAGARAMIADGLFTRFPKPDAGFALHDGNGAYGYVSYRVGVGSSNVDGLFIKFHGRGGHGAIPQATIDPVMMAARFVVDVQSVISREKDPTEFGLVTVGAIHAGTAGNIIPDEAVVIGTIRSFKPQVRAKMLAGIERTARAVAAMADAPAPEIRLDEGTKAVVNDAAVVGPAEKVLKAAFGDKFNVTPANTTSEDYSEFVNAGVPSMFFNIGVYDPERVATARKSGTPLPGNHSPLFAPVPKPTIETGVTAMTLAVLSAFDERAKGN
ncbi:MAG TPA: amidohydrolase [Bradyrhizobium sp.]